MPRKRILDYTDYSTLRDHETEPLCQAGAVVGLTSEADIIDKSERSGWTANKYTCTEQPSGEQQSKSDDEANHKEACQDSAANLHAEDEDFEISVAVELGGAEPRSTMLRGRKVKRASAHSWRPSSSRVLPWEQVIRGDKGPSVPATLIGDHRTEPLCQAGVGVVATSKSTGERVGQDSTEQPKSDDEANHKEGNDFDVHTENEDVEMTDIASPAGSLMSHRPSLDGLKAHNFQTDIATNTDAEDTENASSMRPSDEQDPTRSPKTFIDPVSHLPDNLRSLYSLIQESVFYKQNTLEPIIGSQDCEFLLIRSGVTPIDSKLMGKSIYYLFVDEKQRRCLICEKIKTSSGRAVSCVRSHLNHRPFRCAAREQCKLCGSNRRATFFSRALLDDHLKNQSHRLKCIAKDCSSMVRRGEMKRHWNSEHPGEPFPHERYPRYREKQGGS